VGLREECRSIDSRRSRADAPCRDFCKLSTGIHYLDEGKKDDEEKEEKEEDDDEEDEERGGEEEKEDGTSTFLCTPRLQKNISEEQRSPRGSLARSHFTNYRPAITEM